MDAKDLKQIRKMNGISQQDLAAYLGVGQSFISQIERGASPIPEAIANKILANPNWEIVIDTFENHGTVNMQQGRQDEKAIPLVTFDAVAGYGTPVFEDSLIEAYYDVREFKTADFLIRVKGESMTPKYNGGDLVACRMVNDILFLQWGRVYVLYTRSQGVMIKRVQPANDPDNITCVSENQKYSQFEVPKSDIVKLALVVGSISLE